MKYSEVYQATLDYFNNEDLSAKTFADKYALQDNEGDYKELTPDDTHKRLASEFAKIEKKKFKKPLSFETIYDLFKNYERIIPQ
ncbi:MAG: hypothetical protein GTO02_15215, partial [Candidatus Dadabacteria bacterium]|nr:hypothetical protein [Candidatus Dadabacteria bacterium]